MDQDNTKPLPPISKKMASENELPGLKEIKQCEKVMYKPELYDEVRHRSRPVSAPMSKRTIRNRDLISKTKENILHSNLVEKEVEGLNSIDAFKHKLMINTLHTQRKRNPKLSKPIQIEIKKQYLNYKYRNFDPITEEGEENIYNESMNKINDKKKRKKKYMKSSILYDPEAQYMINFNKNEIETDGLMNYIIKKKNEPKKLNINEIYMYKSDIDEIRNRNNRDSVSYNTNFNVSGTEYVGADEQVHEYCHKRNYISLPEKYVQYYKNLEELEDDNELSTSNNNSQNKDNNKDVNNNNNNNNNDDNNNNNKNDNNNNDITTNINNNTKSKSNLNNNEPDNNFQNISRSKKSSPCKTYYGSNSGYNALSRPALNASLVKRHNAHRNSERFNIEQIVLRRNIPNDLIHLSFQNNFESLDELRNELIGHMLKDNVGEKKGKNKKNVTNIKKDEKEKINENEETIIDKCKNENDVSSNNSVNIKNNENNYCNNISKNFKLSGSNLKYKEVNGEEPKPSRKIRILPSIVEPTTPKELLYIIDNYKNIKKKNNNNYKQYNIYNNNNNNNNNKNNVLFVNTSNINDLINSKKSIHNQDLKSNSKVNNPQLSYHEILKALQE
ncbi:hypothetical protein PIROE2DRAFT_6311 [Piromyces sp. E2]|nr:hypothetical protein PIROE2DRAFT_6311 [Piromyces sp. E2]|eukprot:OUM66473.1 hypothetical protein PIROE2DRAFT_6311 [Piromyces sp. E2]